MDFSLEIFSAILLLHRISRNIVHCSMLFLRMQVLIAIFFILIYVFDLMMNYYFIVANKSPKIKELFEKIQKEIQNEISFEEDLMGISKEIESITRIYTTLN